MNEMHEANRRRWDALSGYLRALRDGDGRWQRIPGEPELAFEGGALEQIREYAGDLRGRRACVIGSGDNYAAFALAGLGARVTSVDISARQLAVAAERAARLRLEMEFIRADAARLNGLADGSFDLACSTNGFFVWISDPGRVFRAVERVLRPGGFYIFYDIHPFQRPWKNQPVPLEMEKPYADTGPFAFEDEGAVSYEFNWRMSDLLNPLLDSGLLLRRLVESPASGAHFWTGHSYRPEGSADLMDWRNNPRAGLPVWMTVVAQKAAA